MFEKLIWFIRASDELNACELIKQMTREQVNLRDHNGETALMAAATKKLPKVCAALAEKMSSLAINALTTEFFSALTIAAWNGMDETCVLLVNKMNDTAINAVAYGGNTALIFALKRMLSESPKLMLSRMSTEAINQINENDDSALTIALKNTREEFYETLFTKKSQSNKNFIEYSIRLELEKCNKTINDAAEFADYRTHTSYYANAYLKKGKIFYNIGQYKEAVANSKAYALL